MTELFDVIRRQRAHRQFSDKPLDDEVLHQVLQAAVYAPSAENKQPWEFVVVRDQTLKQEIGHLMQKAWQGGAKQWSSQRLSADLLKDVDAGIQGGIAEAPVIVVVCGNSNKGVDITLPASIFPAVQNLLLAATALGLGSALTTIATHYQKELQELLQLPDFVQAMAIIPLGHPARKLGLSRRNPLSACVHLNTYQVKQ